MQLSQPVRRTARESRTPALQPIRPESTRARASDRVLDQLFTGIRNLVLEPGQSLSETELAEQLHVSRTPLREAIARLVDMGLVTVVPQVGTRVALISMADVVQAQFVRETLEVAAFAAACADPDRDVSVLRGLLAEQRTAWRDHDVDRFFVLDEALHEQVFVLSGFPGAWAAVQGMKVQLDRLRRLMPDLDTIDALIGEHTAIVDALEAGRRPAGQRQTAAHARRVLQYAPSLREQFPDYFAD
ncbi:MAG TPA: GntR family transcriptional regulator [Actinomycetales bacterium]|jgi:DNA-binding GntR family transcriptional regulator